MNAAIVSSDQEQLEWYWRRAGAVGVLHNAIRYIRMTPQRREEFASVVMGGSSAEYDGLEVC